MHRTFALFLAFGSMQLFGCDNTPSSTDGGPTTDAASPVVDAASTADAATSADVAECIELARTFRDNCSESNGPTDVRVCVWESYEALCTTGRTDRLLAALHCLDASACRIFSDANDGTACLQELFQDDASSAQYAAAQSISTTCSSGAPGLDVFATMEILPYLSDADAGVLQSSGCVTADTCTLDGIIAACSTIPGLEPFASCN